ncbi:MAG: WG repeat-containing protein [Saprospiraceae bacterium]|nr:WG repeat-containing protein [Saprospiraceae bacterium]
MKKYCFYLLLVLALTATNMAAQEVGAPWIVPPVMNIDDKFDISPKENDSRFIGTRGRFQGVFDKTGKAILPVEKQEIMLVPCGWIVVSRQNDQRLLYNAQATCMSLPYDQFNAYNNGTALVYKNGLCGLINMQGEELVPVQYEKYTRDQDTYVFSGATGERRMPIPPDFVSPNVKRVEDAKAKAKTRTPLAGHYLIKGNGQFTTGLLNLKRDTVVPPIYRFEEVHPSGMITATFDGKTFGVIDAQHHTLYSFTAAKVGKWTKSGLLPVKFEKKWALIRFPAGDIIFSFGEYDYIETYDPEKDLFIVSKNKLLGLINLKRKFILPCAYTYISQYDHVTTQISDTLHKSGFCYRPTGFILKPQFKYIRNLNDTLVIVSSDSLTGVMNAKTGKYVIPMAEYQIECIGQYFDSHKPQDWRARTTLERHIHGLYDRRGRLVIPHDTADIVMVPKEQTFWICYQREDSSRVWEQRDLQGKTIRTIPKKGADLKKLGYLPTTYRYGNGVETAMKITYTDAQGNEQLYSFISTSMRENLRMVQLGNLWGFVDSDGQVVIQPVMDKVESSKDGYIKAKYQGKWGVLQNPKFDYFEEIEKGIGEK